MANPKSIGNSFEREFSKLISKWFTGSDEDLVVWRNQSSGSVGTIRRNKGLKSSVQNADINCLDPKYKPFFDKFYVDTKSYQDINPLFNNKANQKSNAILNQWIKTVEECPEGMIPIMPVKIRNKKTPLLLVCNSDFKCKFNNRIEYFLESQKNIIIYYLDEIFSLNDWEEIVGMSN